MPDKDKPNYLSVGYVDSAELIEKLGDLEPGDDFEMTVKGKVRANEDNILQADISEVKAEDGFEPVTEQRAANDGGAVSIVISSKGGTIAQ